MNEILSTISDDRRTHADRLFRLLEHEIVSGQIAMGTKLKEEALAERFGVSRGPLREALQRLEARSLVVSTARSSGRVVSLGQQDVVELYEIRESLETLAVRLATQRMSDAELDGLDDLLARNVEKVGADSDVTYSQGVGEGDFHYRIARGSKSARLQRLLCDDLYSLIRMCRFKTWAIPGQRKSANGHRQILEAMKARDSELAEFFMRRHVANARERFLVATSSDEGAE